MARVLVLVDDLMLSSKVTETLRSAGHEVVGERGEPAEAIVADLDAVDAGEVAALGPPALGFCRHTDVETRERALAAGFARVVPRSRMARELPGLVSGLLS
jgi:hypothetical protein